MESPYSIQKVIQRFSKFRYKLVLEGVCVGAAAGMVVVLFRLILGKLEYMLENIATYVNDHPSFLLVWFGILLLGAIITTILLKWEPMISGSGIPQLDGEIQGYFHPVWWRVLIAKFIGGMITIGSGLSLGREGPSIQLGAMVGQGFSKITKRMQTEEKMLVTCGASAGISAAFNAPIAGVLFALEEVHKNFSVEILLSSLASSITADFISRNIFGLRPVFDFPQVVTIPLSHFGIVMLMGIFIGLVGVIYIKSIDLVQILYSKIPVQFLRTLIPFVLAGIMLYYCPIVLGGGSNLVMEIYEGIPLKILFIILIIKFLFSILSFGAGVPGGIFLPLLVLGAMCSGIFHGVANYFGFNLNLTALIILGMAGSFAAIVRAPITGIILITEMTGNFSHLLFIALVSLIAYAVADLIHSKPIYDQLLRKLMLKFGRIENEDKGEKMLIPMAVNLGSILCDKEVKNVNLPENCLIISVKRGESEIVPCGDTILKAGDLIEVICRAADSAAVCYSLERQCKVLDL